MEKALKKAIEGGYNEGVSPEHYGNLTTFQYEAFTDPLFWKYLGKTRGWLDRDYVVHWHSFIDHLISGKDIETFFEDLLK